MALVILPKKSHLDHGLTPQQIGWIVVHFADRTGFFRETVELPADLGTVPSGIYGPIVGDRPVSEKEVFYATRGTRTLKSRLTKRPPRDTRFVTVIAGPVGDEPCALYTAYGGPLAPREPGDPSMNSDAERRESALFWRDHALSSEP